MQDAYERYVKNCLELWHCTPAPIEVYERQIGSVSSFGGTIAANSSFLGKSRTT